MRCNPMRWLALLALWLGAPTVQAGSLTISEVLYDAEGPDDGKVFVELFGPPGTVLEGFTLEGVNGADGAVGPRVELAGSIGPSGFFVIGDLAAGVSEVSGVDLLRNFDPQNGPDSIRLLAPDGSLVDALGYGSFGPTDVFAGEGQPAPDVPAGQSLARIFADLDTDDNRVDFRPLAIPSPGSGPRRVPEAPVPLLLGCALLALGMGRKPRAWGNPPGVVSGRF